MGTNIMRFKEKLISYFNNRRRLFEIINFIFIFFRRKLIFFIFRYLMGGSNAKTVVPSRFPVPGSNTEKE